MNGTILQTNNLSKTFSSGKGKKTKKVEAVKSVDLEVKEGEIFGFLGPNGAGKSTTLNILTTLLPPSSGKATVADLTFCGTPKKSGSKLVMFHRQVEQIHFRMRLKISCFRAAYMECQNQKLLK